jgi:XTP/dITP diphosphohydrolase/ATP diphosphatase
VRGFEDATAASLLPAGKLEDVTESLNLEEQAGAAAAVGRAAAIMARLRRPGGCPWDAEQTFDSIKRHTLEETYEVFDAIERRDWAGLKDELGDLLLQVLFYAEMAQEAGYFTLEDVAENLTAKLVRRHPHVFGDVEAADANAVLRNWEQIKREEKQARHAGEEKRESMLDDIPRSMPAVMEAGKLGSRAAKVGFDWPSVDGLFDKLAEETGELREEIGKDAKSEGVEEELGDLLFTAVNLARHLRVDPEFALRGTNAKFRTRFGAMEAEAGGREKLEGMSAEELEGLWERAKKTEERGMETEPLPGEKN